MDRSRIEGQTEQAPGVLTVNRGGKKEGKEEKEGGGAGEREKIKRDYSCVTVTMSVSL